MGELHASPSQRSTLSRSARSARRRASARSRGPARDARRAAAQRADWRARALQPRLAVGAADDPFEREAERTADA